MIILYPAVATARVISVPIPPSAPVMIASFMFTNYKLPIIRKIQSPFALFSLSPFSSRQAVLPANADDKPFLWNTSGLCSNYCATVAAGILSRASGSQTRFVEWGTCHLYGLKTIRPAPHLFWHATPVRLHISTAFSALHGTSGRIFQEIGLFEWVQPVSSICPPCVLHTSATSNVI